MWAEHLLFILEQNIVYSKGAGLIIVLHEALGWARRQLLKLLLRATIKLQFLYRMQKP